ncbi:MAG TPA: hypothetical protein VGF55_25325 [Gemmataceae bacterium]|jgi:hypothetical protein
MKPATIHRLGVLAGLVWAGTAPAQPPTVAPAEYAVTQPRMRLFAPTRPRLAPVPLDVLPANLRDPIARVVRDPTLSAHGPAEEFVAGPYDWLLDHPDRVATAWRRLGVPCVGITNKGDGRFLWSDGEGSDIAWVTAYSGPSMRIWYAEGQAKASTSLPVVPVRAVAVLRHTRRSDASGQVLVTHEVDVYLQTDSRAAALVTRLLGPAAPRMAEQGASQLLMFFSAMAKYLDEHPDQVPTLLRR